MRAVLAAALVLSLTAARAQAQDPLLPEEVAASTAEHYPEVVQALAERQGAAAGLLSARGAFDTVFSVDARSRVTGFYSGDVIEAKAERYLGGTGPLAGTRLYGGYRLADGDFPIYEDEFFTNDSGEVKVGVLFALLRDRLVDDRRFGIRDAELALEQADLEVALTRLGVQRRALLAYYDWVEAGQELAIFQDLLDLAQTRQTAFEQQVERGARAAIFLTENAQNLTRRRILVEGARRDLTLRANTLSLYYRGPDGEPIVADADRLPGEVPLPPPVADADLPGILDRRPDLALLRTAAERARARLGLAENALRPRFDLGVEAGQDLGPIANQAGFSRDQGEVIVGFNFEMPLANRGARGRVARAEAEVEALRAERRLLGDRIETELRDVLVNLETAERLVALAQQEVEQARTMRRAEQRRFEAGASDFFLVNLREEAVADARVRLAVAVLSLNAARTTYDAAVMDMGRLGLSGF